jgi:hypothetical protein
MILLKKLIGAGAAALLAGQAVAEILYAGVNSGTYKSFS